MPSILLVPSVKRSGGTGHIVRCFRILRELSNESRIFLPKAETQTEWGTQELEDLIEADLKEKIVHHVDGRNWDLIVLDQRETSEKNLQKLSLSAPVVGLDEGGTFRPYFDYLIDAFPRVKKEESNIFNESFLVDGKAETSSKKLTGKVLLSFGGEDPADLTHLVFTALIDTGLYSQEDVHVALGPKFSRPFSERCGELITNDNALRKRFHLYDFVFTSFGLTAYEVLREGSLPVLVNPTAYHEKLSRKAGFFSLGVKKVSRTRLKKMLRLPSEAFGKTRDAETLKNTLTHETSADSLGVFLSKLAPPAMHGCPACKRKTNLSIQRFPDTTYFRCQSCGIEYMEKFSAQTITYDEKYFFREYHNQYGKTYLEDFDTIRIVSERRLSELSGIVKNLSGMNLLDVGCAYGPFLSAARNMGIHAHGIDICEDAVRYVRDELKIQAAAGDFRELSLDNLFGIGTFDIVSLWYVIEHFPDLQNTLVKINSLVKEGGWLLLSTPNARGVSGVFSPREFHGKSPSDHFTLWDRKSADKVLKFYGFSIRKTVVTGHHPERFPRILRKILGLRGCKLLSGIFGLGDTFEIYARKGA